MQVQQLQLCIGKICPVATLAGVTSVTSELDLCSTDSRAGVIAVCSKHHYPLPIAHMHVQAAKLFCLTGGGSIPSMLCSIAAPVEMWQLLNSHSN